MTELPIRAATAADWPAIAEVTQTAFHDSWSAELDRAERGVFEPERSLLVTDGSAVVGHAAAFTRALSVPGGVVPAAHVAMVGVVPTHRRRGLLTRLMHRQLAGISEPIAVLWSSEGGIYPRFGYGMATTRFSFSIDAREVRLPQPRRTGRLRMGEPGALRKELAGCYQHVRPERPGWSARNEPWWSYVLADPPDRRGGRTALKAVVHESPDDPDRPGGVDGYALWRVRGDWGADGPEGEVTVKELVAATPDAYLALWRFLLSIDLTRSASLWFGGADEPLLHLADQPRRLRTTVGDGLSLRVVDLPAALTARRYAAPVDVVLDVTDRLLPGNAGRWRLVGDADKATCTRVTDPADLACDIADLGAAYLGGTSLGALAAAGRVHELRQEVLPAVSTAFGWHRAPSGLEAF